MRGWAMCTAGMVLALLVLAGAASAEEFPMRFLPGSRDGLIKSHLFSVPVKIGDYHTEFILDTGIGVDLISTRLARRLMCPTTGVTFTGQRMSGQAITLPLTWLPSLALGSHRQTFVTVGVWDFAGFLPSGPEWERIEGFLSLNFFRTRPFTLDYATGRVLLSDEPPPGTPLDLTLHDELGVSLTAFASLQVGGRPATVEIDTGSDSLILHERYLPPGLAVKTVTGNDETGHVFTRRFGTLPGPVSLGGHPFTRVRTMFQDIIYDGLVGHELLKEFTVTFDLAHSRVYLAKP